MAKGKFIVRLDAMTCSPQNSLEFYLRLNCTKADFYSDYFVIDADGNIVEEMCS